MTNEDRFLLQTILNISHQARVDLLPDLFITPLSYKSDVRFAKEFLKIKDAFHLLDHEALLALRPFYLLLPRQHKNEVYTPKYPLTPSELEIVQARLKEYEEAVRLLTKNRKDIISCEITKFLWEERYKAFTHQITYFKSLLHKPEPVKKKKGLYSQEDVERAKRTPITRLVDTSKGRTYANKVVIPCPLNTHTDSSPSFTIYVNQNSFYCYGCAKHGDAIGFLQESQGLSFKEAIAYLLGVS